MKIQIRSFDVSPIHARVQISLDEDPGMATWIVLPTHEKLTLDGLKAAIKGELKKMDVVRKRMSIMRGLLYQEIEID